MLNKIIGNLAETFYGDRPASYMPNCVEQVIKEKREKETQQKIRNDLEIRLIRSSIELNERTNRVDWM